MGRVNRNSTFPVGSNSLCWVVSHETKNQIDCQSCSLSVGPSVYKVIKCFLYDFISSNGFPSIGRSFVCLRCLSLLVYKIEAAGGGGTCAVVFTDVNKIRVSLSSDTQAPSAF